MGWATGVCCTVLESGGRSRWGPRVERERERGAWEGSGNGNRALESVFPWQPRQARRVSSRSTCSAGPTRTPHRPQLSVGPHRGVGFGVAAATSALTSPRVQLLLFFFFFLTNMLLVQDGHTARVVFAGYGRDRQTPLARFFALVSVKASRGRRGGPGSPRHTWAPTRAGLLLSSRDRGWGGGPRPLSSLVYRAACCSRAGGSGPGRVRRVFHVTRPWVWCDERSAAQRVHPSATSRFVVP